MANIIILGDPHLGKNVGLGKVGVGASLNSKVVDQLNLLDWVLDQAIENNVYVIVITGDVFEDPNTDSVLITYFLNWINKCGANNVNVHVIRGNHDIKRFGSSYTSPLDIISECELENCIVYKDISTIYINSVAFTYLPFRDRKSFICESNFDALNLLKNMLMYEFEAIPIPYTKILIGHLAIEGSIPVGDEIDDIVNELFCPIDMFNGYDYVWMGHVHKPQVMQKKPLIAHIGSMDISNFGETDHKKHIVIFDTDNLSYSKVEIPTRKLNKIVISIPKNTIDTTKYIIDEILNKKIELNQCIVRLEVTLSATELQSINRSEIEKFLYKEGVFNISGFSESKKSSFIKKDDSQICIDTTIDVSAAIKMWAEKKWTNNIDLSKKLEFIESAINIYKDYKVGMKA